MYYCYLQCAVQQSEVLSSIRDSMGQQKGCRAIKNDLNHQPSCRRFVSEFWGLGRAALRWRRLIQVDHPYISLARCSTSTRLSWGEPPTPAASEHTCQSPERGVRAATLQYPPDKQSNVCEMNWWVGKELYILLYIKTQLSELTVTRQREPAIISLKTRTSADEIIDDCGW